MSARLVNGIPLVQTPHCAHMTPEGVDLLNSGAAGNVMANLEGLPMGIHALFIKGQIEKPTFRWSLLT